MRVTEHYKDFKPEVNALATVNRLVKGIKDEYLNGLDAIVLTNTDALNRQRRRQKTWSRKRKVAVATDAAGLYHRAWKGEKAWIEIFVNHIPLPPRYLRWIPLLRDLVFADVLFHELGHHIHSTRAPSIASARTSRTTGGIASWLSTSLPGTGTFARWFWLSSRSTTGGRGAEPGERALPSAVLRGCVPS